MSAKIKYNNGFDNLKLENEQQKSTLQLYLKGNNITMVQDFN